MSEELCEIVAFLRAENEGFRYFVLGNITMYTGSISSSSSTAIYQSPSEKTVIFSLVDH